MNTPGTGDYAAKSGKKKKKRRTRKWRIRLSRDGTIFLTGLVGIGHEIFFSSADRPYLIFLFGAMIGLPAFLRIDERGREDEDE